MRPLLEDRWAHGVVLLTASVLLDFAVFYFVATVWRQTQEDEAPPRPQLRRVPTWTLIVANTAPASPPWPP
ncbi:hypothetical protein [Phenylobacterium immobile]|uniref:hypothetical protein n=1 Tax=Phenylobacterium immobile TaxID=21 RepID=UPI000A7279AC|nr:hypothetical protein [Phenylobacterium immobile]